MSSPRRLQSAVEGVAAAGQQGNVDMPSIVLGQGLSMPYCSAVGSNGTTTLQNPQPTHQGMLLQAPIDR